MISQMIFINNNKLLCEQSFKNTLDILYYRFLIMINTIPYNLSGMFHCMVTKNLINSDYKNLNQ